MREILFRGKTDKGEWVYGYPYERYNNCHLRKVIAYPPNEFGQGKYIEVVWETLSQYTGLTDKNGTKIFEGDILKTPAWYTVNDLPCVVIFGEEHTVSNVQGFGLYHHINESYELVCSDEWDEFEVIGNIHDNPELLKGGAE